MEKFHGPGPIPRVSLVVGTIIWVAGGFGSVGDAMRSAFDITRLQLLIRYFGFRSNGFLHFIQLRHLLQFFDAVLGGSEGMKHEKHGVRKRSEEQHTVASQRLWMPGARYPTRNTSSISSLGR